MGKPTIRASNLFKVRTLTRSTMKWLGMYPFRAVYIPLAFATWACGSQGLGIASALFFIHQRLVFSDMTAHAGPVTYRVSLGQCQKEKTRKMLCGLGSWREQQQTIEISQKFICCLARPHRTLRVFY